ncbi:MAG: cytochrome C, partial [Betaproteobacteria bacterium]|nr:cytochrome C [Betaproteobacteria bacterium]
MAQTLESVLSPGPVIKGHAKVENECSKCHVRFNRDAQDGRCLDCHKETAADVRAHVGLHGRQKPQPCRECHTDHRGRD